MMSERLAATYDVRAEAGATGYNISYSLMHNSVSLRHSIGEFSLLCPRAVDILYPILRRARRSTTICLA